MQHPIETNEKIKMNAISAYLMIIANVFFLFNRSNPLINNLFVKSHTRSALAIHGVIFFIVIVFLWFKLFAWITILGVALNSIIASTILLWLFWILLFGIYKAHKWEYFTIWEILHIAKTEKIIDINNDHTLDEKDKLTIILTFIPFLGYIIHGMYSENATIRNLTKFNLICSLCIFFIFISNHANLAIFLSLIYIIFIVFSSIILIGKNEIFSFNLDQIPSFSEAEMYTKSMARYLLWFFSKKFTGLSQTILLVKWEKEKDETTTKETTQKLTKYTWHKALIYIPGVNLINIFKLQTQLRTHIINGVTLSLLCLISWAIWGISNSIQFTALFPIFFGIWLLNTHSTYKMPFIFPIGNFAIEWIEKIIYSLLKAKKTSQNETLKPQK